MLKPRLQVLNTSRVNRLPVAPRPSQRAGYRVRGRQGQRIRAAHLRENPLCAMCLERCIVTEAMEVDHIIALKNGGTDTDDNKQNLCIPCHQRKSKNE